MHWNVIIIRSQSEIVEDCLSLSKTDSKNDEHPIKTDIRHKRKDRL